MPLLGGLRLMGFRQESAALAVELAPAAKHVLQVLAFHACERCGRAWPGVPTLVAETCLGERAVRQALADLRQRPDLLTVYRYPNGGRGVTTEYLVMPQVAEFSTAACGKCRSIGDTLHKAQGKRASGEQNPARRGSKTLHQAADQPSEQPQPSARLHARAPLRGAAEPPGPPPPSSTAPEAPTVPVGVSEVIPGILIGLEPPERRTGHS